MQCVFKVLNYGYLERYVLLNKLGKYINIEYNELYYETLNTKAATRSRIRQLI